MNFLPKRCLRVVLLCLCLAGVGGCATLGSSGDIRDPYEGFNRSVTSFNEFIDKLLFEPLMNFYKAITPDFLDRAISNFFDNLNDVVVVINDFLQFKFKQMIADILRFIFNTTLGIAGLFDVSSGMGFTKHHEDFGQTLGVWGFNAGPYLVIPFLGPSSVRDAVGRFALGGWYNSPLSYINNDTYRYGLMSLNYIDYRADNLSAQNLIGEAALDEYEFTKTIYLERREDLVHDRDGEMPSGFEEFDPTIIPE